MKAKILDKVTKKEKRELTYKDYLDFKNQARKSLGEPVECDDLGDDANAVSREDAAKRASSFSFCLVLEFYSYLCK